ncbi:MAG: hypothetical protein LQ341_001287, partial [Variospora aurantia]
GGDRALEGNTEENSYLIEDAPAEIRLEHAESNNGILSDSTLAAWQSYVSQNYGNGITVAAPAAASSGPLVGYGSDDDSS